MIFKKDFRKAERDLTQKEKAWVKKKTLLEREFSLKEDKEQFKKMKIKKPTTTKLLITFLFLNCTLIELFTGWVTIKSFSVAIFTGCSPDLTPLITLIGAVVGEVIGFAVYAVKSTKENTSGGIVYDSALNTFDNNTNNGVEQ